MRLLVVVGHENDKDGNLSFDAGARCRKAAELALSFNEEYRILPTGGFGDYFNQSDVPHGSLIRDRLVDLGVDKATVLPTTVSAGTIEDAWCVLRYVHETAYVDQIDVVTSAFHMPRVRFIFSRTFSGMLISFHAVENASERSRLRLQEQHETKRLRETAIEWGDVRRFDLTRSPDCVIANLGDELRHYDNLSLASVTAILVAFGYIVTSGLTFGGPEIPNLIFLIGSVVLAFLYNLYARFAATAASARRVLKAAEIIYGIPGISSTKTEIRLFGTFISAKRTIAIFVTGLILFLVLSAFIPPNKIDQSGGAGALPRLNP